MTWRRQRGDALAILGLRWQRASASRRAAVAALAAVPFALAMALGAFQLPEAEGDPRALPAHVKVAVERAVSQGGGGEREATAKSPAKRPAARRNKSAVAPAVTAVRRARGGGRRSLTRFARHLQVRSVAPPSAGRGPAASSDPWTRPVSRGGGPANPKPRAPSGRGPAASPNPRPRAPSGRRPAASPSPKPRGPSRRGPAASPGPKPGAPSGRAPAGGADKPNGPAPSQAAPAPSAPAPQAPAAAAPPAAAPAPPPPPPPVEEEERDWDDDDDDDWDRGGWERWRDGRGRGGDDDDDDDD